MYKLRQYQDESEQSIWDYLVRKSTGNPLVCLPTGTGKGVVIASFIKNVCLRYPGTRILALTHVKELIEQNSDKLRDMWPQAPYGIYSAGLRKKQVSEAIIFGGVASVVRNIEQFGMFHLGIVDEAHLMSGKDDSMYGEIISKLTALNPKFRVVGFTATPYRTGMGMLTENGLFTDIAIDYTNMKAFNRLIDEGYMATLIPKRTNASFDVSKVSIQNGDFNQKELEDAIDHQDTNYLACKETVEWGSDRNCWLVFAAGVSHSEHVAEMLRNFGVTAKAVHSKLKPHERDTYIQQYKTGKLRCLVNNNVLTTGFDHPPIDLIAMMRPTMSTGLWVQMLGRGTRPSPDTAKENCLCLDFAQNTPRLGPINDPVLPRRKGSSTGGVAPIRICDQCGTYNHASATRCYVCGEEFPHQIHIQASAGTDELVRRDEPRIEQFRVDRVLYNKFHSNSYNILRVNYVCGIRSFSEVVCLEHPGRAGGMAVQWWKKRMGSDVAPPTVDEALLWVSRLAVPNTVWVDVNKKYPQIIKVEFDQ